MTSIPAGLGPSGPEKRLGTAHTVEDFLALDEDTNSARVGFAWRFKDRHELNIDIYQVHRDGTNNAKTDFDYTTNNGDFVEVEAGARFTTEINFDIYDISYRY